LELAQGRDFQSLELLPRGENIMSYITQDKLVILGAAGAIGSNLTQAALTMGLTPNVCMYDPFEKGLKGAAEEIYHCAFPGARVTWTTDIKTALTGASKYIISSGGAPRKEGMTREDLLKGNCEIAAQLGKDIRAYCPGLKFAAIIFNPADITGLTVLVHSGLHPSEGRHPGRAGQHPPADRAGPALQGGPGQRHRLPHLRRARRA
jgi:malate dehydrogenase